MSCPCLRTAACAMSADYSKVSGDPILPFLFELDQEASILAPDEGENQRFCYHITGQGENTSEYADLSHFVLGICENITADQIKNIKVVRDGVALEVVFGENVELKTAASPDPTTGCPGLKFDFSLNKVSGDMEVCFELTKNYAVGPVRVCVKGGQETQNGLFICGPSCQQEPACQTEVYQRMQVCVPITVTPYAYTGEAQTYCCGDPVVVPGDTPCGGKVGAVCTFTVSRTLCVAIPVAFGAQAFAGAPSTECLGASATETCADCQS